jgi:hypothetical protein
MAARLGLFAAENAPLLEEEAMVAARLLSRAGRGAARFGRAGYRAAARMAGKAYRVGKENPFTAGMLAQSAISKLGQKKKKRKLGRPLPGPVKKPRTVKATGAVHATFGTKFRKGVRPRVAAKFTKRHYDDFGTASRLHTLYAGFQTHGSLERVCDIYAEALMRYIFSVIDIRPSTYDEVCVTDYTGTNDDLIKFMNLGFRKIDDQTGADLESTVQIQLVGRTFEAICGDVGANIESKLQNGEYVTYCRIYKTVAGGDVLLRDLRDLENGKLEVQVKQIIRVQNLTPNDDSSTALDVTGTNPIQGKIYDFTTVPMLRAGVQSTHPGLDTLQDHTFASGINVLGNITETGSGGVLGHPPNAGELFTNCRKVANVRIDAGHNKFKTTWFSFKGSLIDFMKRFKYGDNERALGGGITYLGFENAFRSGQDTVKIAYNRELSMSAYYRVTRKKPMLRHYQQNDMGDLV